MLKLSCAFMAEGNISLHLLEPSVGKRCKLCRANTSCNFSCQNQKVKVSRLPRVFVLPVQRSGNE